MTDHDERLVRLLDDVLAGSSLPTRAQRLAAAVAANPDLAQEIRELAATALIADDVASFHSGEAGPQSANRPDHPGGAEGEAQVSAVGTQIGDYVLLEELGRGGMGVVYRARQQSLNRDVALKMIPNAAFAASDDLARLHVEALAAGQLSHPNVVPVFDVGEYRGQPWFCMKYIAGETLNDRLRQGPMESLEAVRLLLPIVRAVQSAHAGGILHRDLKPSNIMISDDGTPFVTDFGLAKRTRVATESRVVVGDDQSITQTGAVLGTPAWMSPEQAAGQRRLQSGSHSVCDADRPAAVSGRVSV